MNILLMFARLPGVPVEMLINPARVRGRRRGKYLRTESGGPAVGRKRYRASVNLQMSDGTVVLGHSIGPIRQTRFQARKLLDRSRSICPYIHLWIEQEIQ